MAKNSNYQQRVLTFLNQENKALKLKIERLEQRVQKLENRLDFD